MTAASGYALLTLHTGSSGDTVLDTNAQLADKMGQGDLEGQRRAVTALTRSFTCSTPPTSTNADRRASDSL